MFTELLFWLALKKDSEDSKESDDSDDDKYLEMLEAKVMHQRPYERLIVWQEAHKLCLWVYNRTKVFPRDERYELVSQMRTSASSVPTNIAEGNSRSTIKDKSHFFVIAHSSLEETHYHVRLAKDLGYLTAEEFVLVDDAVQRISFLLTKLKMNAQAYSKNSSDSSES